MNKSKKPLITIYFLLISALLFSDIRAQTKQPPQTIAAGVVNGKAVTLPKPEYPADAKKQGVTGKVDVQVVIDENGSVISAKAVSGIENTAVRKACEEAAMKSKFSPTKLSGKPVKVTGVIVYNFVSDPSNEEKVKAFGISTFLFTLRSAATDLEKLYKFFETDNIINETIDEFSSFSPELAQLAPVAKLPPAERLAKIDEVIFSIKSKLNSSDLWQFELGKAFAVILEQFSAMGAEENFDISKFDEKKVKQSLAKIKELCAAAPPDFPKDVLVKLDEFASFGNDKQIMSDENFADFFNRMQALFETISPGSTK